MAGAWDEVHTCDPNVVKGSFSYGGSTYTWAMYYAGHANSSVVYTQIGVAFSNDGINWVKHPNPVVAPAGPPDVIYGAGVPSFYRFQGSAAAGYLAWWDSTWPGGPRNVFALTADGINFGARQLFPTSIQGIIGDIAYNPADGLWYATSTTQSTTYDVYVYQTADPYGVWTEIGHINAAVTGNTHNHNSGFVRYPNGDLWVASDGAKYVSFGTGSGAAGTWDLGYAHWY